mmetsp:Transcript_14435/g.30394  ORF Transcript_14435/g.30394 Transcript_14435/m.30394 type:complete len:657 (-) Transcript_14435:49-2019(-)
MASQQLGAIRRRLPHLLSNHAVTGTILNFHSKPHVPSHTLLLPQQTRHFSSPATNAKNNTTSDASSSSDAPPSIDPQTLSAIYNRQRATYKKSVSFLRKQYFAEIQSQRERDARLAAIQKAKEERAVLERRRIKAAKSARNAAREVEKREERRREFERELALTQREREAKRERYRRAKQRVVDGLEEECRLWLTTEEEVEKALGNPTAAQVLWARPGGMIGAPSGPETGFGDDGDFWRYECHTWDARPIYKEPKEVLLEELEYLAYLQANNMPGYWTPEKVELENRIDMRARLRAIVREEGRRSLLEKQRQLMKDVYGNSDGNAGERGGLKLPPTAMPAPKLDYLADYEAQEREGAEILRRDPRRFFLFESDLPTSTSLGDMHDNSDDSEDGTGSSGESKSVTASLGRPVGLRNPFFNNQPTAFPPRLGRDLPPDTRTEKQKKQDERQERMRAAAEEAALAAKKGMAYEVAMAAEEDLDDGSEDVDYDLAERDAEKHLWDGKMGEWKDVDKSVFEMTPPMARLTDEEVDWILEQLQDRVKRMQDRVEFEEKIRQKELASSGSQRTLESIDDVDSDMMQDLGYDTEAMMQMVRDLTPEQTAALEQIDFTGRDGITADEMSDELRKVPGLTDEQIQMLVEMEMSLLQDDSLKNITKMD